MLIPGLNAWYSLLFQLVDYSVDYHIHFIVFGRSFACPNTFILAMNCFITCRSLDHVISPECHLSVSILKGGIIVCVKREKGLRLVF